MSLWDFIAEHRAFTALFVATMALAAPMVAGLTHPLWVAAFVIAGAGFLATAAVCVLQAWCECRELEQW